MTLITSTWCPLRFAQGTIARRAIRLMVFASPLLLLLIGDTIALSRLAAADPLADQETPAPDISQSQQQILKDYQRFEKQLFDLAEHARLKDPERAEVLYRARSQSQEARVIAEMQVISELLRAGKQYGDAAARQSELLTRMQAVLKLLQSLDERERIANDKKRFEEYLKEANRLIARQKDVRADTQRSQSTDRSLEQQEQVQQAAQALADKIDRHDEERAREEKSNPPQNQEPQENSPNSPPGSEQSPTDPQPGNENPPGETPPAEGSEASPTDPSQGQPQQGQPQPNQSQTAGRDELEAAREAMQQAIEQLQQELPDLATEAQQAAIARLERLKAELEKILRQLREEEKETYLTLLEARFQNMLRRQERINTETTRLDQVPAAERPPSYSDKTLALKREQDDNITEAEKTLGLLKEEGTSVAFPEALEQLRENMEIVSNRLQEADTGATTQLVEQLIVESLNEMILAFQKELKDKQEQDQKPKQPQQGEPQDPGLVQQIAELKMIRSLQLQINRLTQQIGGELSGEQATDPDQLKLIQNLSRRQDRIQDATYDLSVGKNR